MSEEDRRAADDPHDLERVAGHEPRTGVRGTRLQGRVSWVAGETLVMSTDETPSIRIDLSQVDQADYQRLASGDRVIVTGIIVTGTIPDDRDRIVATSIVSLSP
jgi:hypothetical protein